MPDLSQSLQGKDLGFLRIIAEMWRLEMDAADTRTAIAQLSSALHMPGLLQELIETLPPSVHLALEDLYNNGGRLRWSLFTRRYGAVRDRGPAWRDRERPYLNPASPAEILWYRALVCRAFLESPDGPEEFAFIPDDLLARLPTPERLTIPPPGRPATAQEYAFLIPACDRIIDHAATLLAARRSEISDARLRFSLSPQAPYPLSPSILSGLLTAARLLDRDGLPRAEESRAFLQAPRGEALKILVCAWLDSPDFNELRLLPGLRCEGDWKNNPLRARQVILDFLHTALHPSPDPIGNGSSEETRRFWNLPSFIMAIHQQAPDFQRPAGDYDSWFIRDEESGKKIRGFEHWDVIDGALVHFLLCGPLHWLGILDLASPSPGALPAAFRLSAWGEYLLRRLIPETQTFESGRIEVSSDARLRVPRLSPRAARYQISRFCTWEGETDETYFYRLTPASLRRAAGQGLKVHHLLALLRRANTSIPPNLGRTLQNWEQNGAQVHMRKMIVLKVDNQAILQALRSSRAARFLGEPLGPSAIAIHSGAEEKVLEVLAEIGYLGEIEET